MRLINFLLTHLPERPVLVEPFVGAGALFANTHHHSVIINDINLDLINIYKQVKKNNRQFLIEAKSFFHPKFNNKHSYYSLRDQFNQCQDPFERALLFLYLNRHGYNGLCRYNLKGGYNVPFGAYHAPYFPQKELTFFGKRLKNAKLNSLNFIDFLTKLSKKSNLEEMVIYCDPPYIPLSKTANFTGYAACKFSEADQIKLAGLATNLTQKGAKVMVSNHDTPFTRKLYKQAQIETIHVQRAISCQGTGRHLVPELLAIYE